MARSAVGTVLLLRRRLGPHEGLAQRGVGMLALAHRRPSRPFGDFAFRYRSPARLLGFLTLADGLPARTLGVIALPVGSKLQADSAVTFRIKCGVLTAQVCILTAQFIDLKKQSAQNGRTPRCGQDGAPDKSGETTLHFSPGLKRRN